MTTTTADLARTQREAQHPLLRRATEGSLLRDLIDEVIPEFAALTEVEAAAAAMITADQSATVPVPWPASADAVTDAWLTAEVTRRRALQARDERMNVLCELIIDSRRQVSMLVEDNAEQLMDALDVRLQTLAAHAAAAVEALGVAATAAQAIEANAANHWKTVAELRPQYDAIRSTQRTLYEHVLEFDRLPFGDGIPGSHPEARTYYHSRLDDIAPHWRGRIANGVQHPPEYPWPTDPVEQLVWFVRNNSGMWCPARLRTNSDVPRRYSLDARNAEIASL